eukprot:SAG11_NODE_13886_length_634_cov_3.603738_1_plen_107_part_00
MLGLIIFYLFGVLTTTSTHTQTGKPFPYLNCLGSYEGNFTLDCISVFSSLKAAKIQYDRQKFSTTPKNEVLVPPKCSGLLHVLPTMHSTAVRLVPVVLNLVRTKFS